MKFTQHLNRAPARARRRFAGVTACVVFVVTGAHLVKAAVPDSEPTYTGCLAVSGSKAGTVAAVKEGSSPFRPCSSSEKQVALSGGDITAIVAGTGLRVTSGSSFLSDTQGDVSLDLGPSFRLPQGCANGQVPTLQGAVWACATPAPPPPAPLPAVRIGRAHGPDIIGDTDSVVASPLSLPAGAWAIVAKVNVALADGNDEGALFAQCRLDVTGRESLDSTSIWVDAAADADVGESASWGSGELMLETAVVMNEPFNTAVVCHDAGGDMEWQELQIMAMPQTDGTRVAL
jgi:hypothetical protein